MSGMRRRVVLSALAVLAIAQGAAARDAQPWPDSHVGRLTVFALIEELNGALLANRSATATLENWCGTHHMADPARIVAIADRRAQKPLSSLDRAVLAVDPNESVIYRRVALACGSHILSRAENWYVPSRLTSRMNMLLITTDTPFGRAVIDLHAMRQTLSVERLWSPLPAGWENEPLTNEQRVARTLTIPPQLFRHRAVLYDSQRRPIALVVETYTGEILNFAR